MTAPPHQVPRGWLYRPRANPMASVRLACFAHAGAGASMFHAWASRVGPDVEVCAVQPPGREWRAAEPPPATLAAWMDEAAAALLAEPPLPLALFGHSLGAIVAHGVAERLARHAAATGTRDRCGLLVVSGRYPPWHPDQTPAVAHLGDDAFVAEMRDRYGAFPDEILREPELLAHVLPPLRVDLALLEAHESAPVGPPAAPLACPVLALAGREDGFAPSASLRAWRQATRAGFALHELPGGHFFVNESRDALLALVAPSLRALAGR